MEAFSREIVLAVFINKFNVSLETGGINKSFRNQLWLFKILKGRDLLTSFVSGRLNFTSDRHQPLIIHRSKAKRSNEKQRVQDV